MALEAVPEVQKLRNLIPRSAERGARGPLLESGSGPRWMTTGCSVPSVRFGGKRWPKRYHYDLVKGVWE